MRSRGLVRALSFHARYRCRDVGACCTSGWRIPVEAERLTALEKAAAHGALAPAAIATETRGTLTVLALASSGACAAYLPPAQRAHGACSIHRALGHDALPSACRHFPRVCRIDEAGVSVTLSHFCPTAAALLCEDGVEPVTIVENPPAFPEAPYEGLDARGALPPLLRPGLLMDLASYQQWEVSAVSRVADATSEAEALGAIAAGVDHARRWTPSGVSGPLSEFFGRESIGSAVAAAESAWVTAGVASYDEVRACVPEDLRPAPLPPEAALLAAGREIWRPFDGLLCRYAAAKLFGNWVAYQGRGLRTIVAWVATAIAVVRCEAARVALDRAEPLTRASLIEGIRRADLLFVHQIDQQRLVDRIGRVERM